MSISLAERRQVEIRGGYGETEVVWGAPVGPGVYRILNSPVYAYNISAGTVVRVAPADGERLRCVEVLEPSPGATIRIMTAKGIRASELYRERLVRDAETFGMEFGPVTIQDPRIAAIHVRRRGSALQSVSAYFDRLESEGLLKWEVSDPDPSVPIGGSFDESRSSVELIHPPMD